MTRFILLAVMALFFTACGGGSSPQEVTPPAPVPVMKPAIHVHLFGDSTQAWNPHTGIQEALPPGSTVQVSAWPGLTAIQHLNGVGTIGVPPFQWSVENCNCDTVVVNYGINDSTKLGVDPATFYFWISTMRQISTAAGKRFIWETPNPILHAASPILESYAKVADGEVADVYSAFITYGTWSSLMADSLHPNQDGYALATGIVVKSLLKQ